MSDTPKDPQGEMTPIRVRPGELAWAVGPMLVLVWALYLAAELVWTSFQLILILGSAILVAILVARLSALLESYARIPRKVGSFLVLSFVAISLLAGLFVAGSQIVSQFATLVTDLPATVKAWQAYVYRWEVARPFLESLSSKPQAFSATALFGNVRGVFSTAVGFLGALAFFLAVSFYLSIDPRTYRDGLLSLFKTPRRKRKVDAVMTALTDQLWHFMLGQMATMSCLAVLTTVGLWLLEIPSFLALGLIAGGLAFIPVVGPALAFIPAVLVASTKGSAAVVSVVALYGGIQFLEGNFLTPFIQRRMTSIPPVVLLTAQAVMGLLFGLFGVALAAPAAVVVMVLVQELYLNGEAGTPSERTVAVVKDQTTPP